MMGTNTCIGNGTALSVMMREAYVCKYVVPMCGRIRVIRCEDSSRVLIGAAGTWRSDWHRRNLGALISQSAYRLLALAREAIVSTRACASGSLHSIAMNHPEN